MKATVFLDIEDFQLRIEGEFSEPDDSTNFKGEFRIKTIYPNDPKKYIKWRHNFTSEQLTKKLEELCLNDLLP